MSILGKELCNCGALAIWCYAPGYSSGANPHFCNECVPRGCECNHRSLLEDYDNSPTDDDAPYIWISEKTWTRIDSEGRQYPCCEYDYDEDGWEID